MRHTLITGYSGAGKTTVARRLSEETGLPYIVLDEELCKVHDLRSVTDKIADLLDSLDTPHIVEGIQILKAAVIWGKHRQILVDTSENECINRKVTRDNVNRTSVVAKQGVFRWAVSAFRRHPDTEVMYSARS